ncbi:hypothetical protein CIG75_16545 [Tumebacillus algifaecis]|uniref:Uncharacterized protein n=1 Tax=Tumebacillus algifaecis TaxID=1214604 RepID=A0A223D4X7_9BACL|nr:PD-(D/E)XK nuclease family protein [Tumebacillus algifaecis]ASS76404.1 hypothetical protein CIG75_16545 [Tumebacillus algifaecis]
MGRNEAEEGRAVGREVVAGAFHHGHRKIWTERVRQEIVAGRGMSWLYVVPTRGLGSVVRSQSLEGLGGMVGEQVLTIFEVVERVLRHGGKSYVRLDSLGAERLIAKVLRGLEMEWNSVPLAQWAHSPSVVAAFREQIAELRRAGVRPETLLKWGQDSGQEENLAVLAAVFTAYERELSGGESLLLDTEEAYLEAARILEGNGVAAVFPGVEMLFVDSFTDFFSHQLKVLQPLLGIAEVKMFVPFQSERWAWMESLHDLLERTLEQLSELGLQLSFAEEQEGGADVQADLLAVQERLFAPHAQPVTSAPHVHAFCARTEEKEWLWVAKRVKELHRAGVPLGELAVLCNREIRYGSVGHRVLKREGIPLRQQVSLSGEQVPWMRELLTLYALEDGAWNRDLLLQLAAADWLRGEQGPSAAVLHQVVRKLGVAHGYENWAGRLTAEIAGQQARVRRGQTDVACKGLQEVEDLQAVLAWIERLAALVAVIPASAEGGTHAQALRDLMPGVELERRLVLQYRERKGYGMEQLQRELQARETLENVLGALEQLDSVLGDRALYSRAEFAQVVRNHLQREEIVVERGTRGGLQVLSPSAARGMSFAHVFFVGLNEGVWPTPAAAPWLLRAGLREKLAEQIPLFSPQVQVDQQKLFFLLGLHTAREGVWLSYVGGSKQELASRFLDELFELCPDLKERLESDAYLGGSALFPEDGAHVSNPQEARDWTAAQLLAAQAIELVEPEFWFRVVGQAMSERERAAGVAVSRYDGVLADPKIREELGQRFSEETVYSVSQFNRFGECGYKFYLSRVLMLEREQEEAEELSPLAKGNLYHRVLYRLYSQVTAAERMTPDWVERLRGQLASVFEQEWIKAQQERSTEVGVRQLLEKDRLLRRLTEWFEVEAAAWEGMDLPLVPRYLEWVFGMPAAQGADPKSQALPVTVGKLKFRGQVDRVDATREGTFVVVDYKTKNTKAMPKAVEQGLDFQLPVYVKAVEQALFAEGSAAGAAYFSIEKGDRTSSALVKADYLDGLGMGKKRTKLDEESWSELFAHAERTMEEYREQMADGAFAVLPGDEVVCSYCEYRRVCRYDRLRALSHAAGAAREGVEFDE